MKKMEKLEEKLKYEKLEKDLEYDLPKELYGMLKYIQPYIILEYDEE